jgi:hypothetical protein
MAVSIRAVAEPSELLKIEDAWNQTINKYSSNPLFLSGFIKQSMDYYCANGWSPLLVVTSTGKLIVGIAPLMTKKKFGVRFVKFLSELAFSPDFYVDEQYRETFMANTLNFLFRTLKCQFVDLGMPNESPNLKILEQQCKTNRVYFYAKHGRWADMRHSIIPVLCNWDTFKSMRGQNFKRMLKRLERKLNQAGQWRIIHFENENIGPEAIRRIFEVEKKSWKQAWRTERAKDTDQDLLIICQGAQHTIRVEPNFQWSVWFLELDNEVIAYALVLQYKEAAFIIKTSYDERYRRLQPGIFVNNEAIRDLFNKRQVKKIDYLTDLDFHRNWTSLHLTRVRVMLSRKSIIPTIPNILGYLLASEVTRGISESIPEALSKRIPFISELKGY